MLNSLSLHNFRNHADTQFDFHSDIVVFVGANGRGKTNVLEAISVLSTGKSWREKRGVDLIQHDQDTALVRGIFGDSSYQSLIRPRARSFQRNDKKISLKRYLGSLPTLLFAPEHLGIFSGTKTVRQQFFDRFLAQIFPLYRENLNHAKRAAEQKSRLINTAYRQDRDLSWEEILPWNQILAQNVPYIWEKRRTFIKDLASYLSEELATIAGNDDPLEIRLTTPEDYEISEQGVLCFFQQNFVREKAARRNLLSPTRDDFEFMYREKPLLATASRGEERSVLLALLSAKKQFLNSERNVQPILLLDDSFSELDDRRQSQLEKICASTQAFFTTTHPEHVAGFGNNVQMLSL